MSDILQHSRMEWGPTQRDRYGQDLNDAFIRLAEFPLSGRLVETLRHSYRWVRVNEHIVYYQIVNGAPYIARVLHRKMSAEDNL
ncbi:MAG: type II toxin-antitoxin system RelE/ParE family toxin [Thermomicrobiales bacterium]|nr:type II toxin-antitoxin system RelE/ParE family toxin [Thermomicrobiales bacterium]